MEVLEVESSGVGGGHCSAIGCADYDAIMCLCFVVAACVWTNKMRRVT